MTKPTRDWQVARMFELLELNPIHPEAIREMLRGDYGQSMLRQVGYESANKFLTFLESLQS